MPLEVAQRVNVDGTGNVLDLCRAAENLERLAYVSTAYVAGKRTGVVYEHELVMGQDFKNHYESTKFQAEVWVRELLDAVPTTILRPAIVVGDSRTGETEKFDGPYYILRALSRAERLGRAMPQFGRSAAAFNVVPVDYVVAAMVAAAGDEAAVGQTLHLVDPDPLTAASLVALLSQLYAGRAAPRARARRHGRALPAHPRGARDVRGHPAGVDRLPEPPGRLRRPEDGRPAGAARPACRRKFGDYAQTMVDFYRAHEDDPALRPKPPAG